MVKIIQYKLNYLFIADSDHALKLIPQLTPRIVLENNYSAWLARNMQSNKFYTDGFFQKVGIAFGSMDVRQAWILSDRVGTYVHLEGAMIFLHGLVGRPDVNVLKARRDIKGLSRALGYPKEEAVRRQAAWALGELKDVKAVGPLIKAFNDRNLFVRMDVIDALGSIGSPALQPLLVELVNGSTIPGRMAAARCVDQAGRVRRGAADGFADGCKRRYVHQCRLRLAKNRRPAGGRSLYRRA